MLIECQDLTKKYMSDNKEIYAVNNVSLKIKKGDFLVVLGHSGSGKTTLLSLIGGLTSPDSGLVRINKIEQAQLNDNELAILRNKTIGFIFQFASLVPTLTVRENMLLPLSFSPDKQMIQTKVLDLLSQVGLEDKAHVYPAQLSGGQQRRVAIARSFVNDPDIILADEPTGDLDEETESEILDLFRSYNKNGTTFMVVTHNKNLGLSQMNPRVIHMKNGAVVES